jgi:hypothetical protein
MAFEFTDQNFQDEAIDKGGVTVIDFLGRMVRPLSHGCSDHRSTC